MVYVRTYNCYENIKIKLWFTISMKFLTTKRTWLKSLTMFCWLLHPCCFIYWGIPNIISLFSVEQISFMLFYVQDVYQKNSWEQDQRKTDISGVNISSGKSHKASISRTGWSGNTKKSFSSREHLDWFQVWPK